MNPAADGEFGHESMQRSVAAAHAAEALAHSLAPAPAWGEAAEAAIAAARQTSRRMEV
jgi:hypothetical protein